MARRRALLPWYGLAAVGIAGWLLGVALTLTVMVHDGDDPHDVWDL